MDATKIRLSPEEEMLVLRGDWILTKNRVMQKAMQMLGDVQLEQKNLLTSYASVLPQEIIQSSPKISRGENYRGLPWLMLDYPRLFNKEDGFAVRTFFWWGHFFSVTLQLSGRYKKLFETNLLQAQPALKADEFSGCIQDDPWQHHFEPDNYKSLQSFTTKEWEALIASREFVKIAKTIPLQEWNVAPGKIMKIYRGLMQACLG